jgi:hypothetical protein
MISKNKTYNKTYKKAYKKNNKNILGVCLCIEI